MQTNQNQKTKQEKEQQKAHTQRPVSLPPHLSCIVYLHIRMKNQQYYSDGAKNVSPASNCHLLWVSFIIVTEMPIGHSPIATNLSLHNEQYNRNVTKTMKTSVNCSAQDANYAHEKSGSLLAYTCLN